MKDHNLGPDTQKLIDQYRKAAGSSMGIEAGYSAKLAGEMAAMLERWLADSWCWPDASPSHICGGPHVLVRYDELGVDVIEPKNRVGQTFKEATYAVIAGAPGTGTNPGHGPVAN